MTIKNYITAKKMQREAKRWLTSDPVGTAAFCTFYLNQYARNSRRSSLKHLIYNLKKEMVKWLYQNNYCIRVSQSHQTMTCWHTFDYNQGIEDHCEKCFGTGIYRQHVLYMFTFSVGSFTYIWHQPESLINFDVTTNDDNEGISDTLPEYHVGKDDFYEPLQVSLRSLYLYVVKQFLEAQGVKTQRIAPTLGSSLIDELKCQRCKGVGYTLSHHINPRNYHARCMRCLTMGSRFSTINKWKVLWFRIFNPQQIPYEINDIIVPLLLRSLVRWKDQQRQARVNLNYNVNEEDIPF